MPTMEEAVEDMQAQFWASWKTDSLPFGPAGAPVDVRWPNDEDEAEPVQGLPWARFSVTHVDGDAYSMGTPGNRLFEHVGWVGIQIFVPLGDGLAAARKLAMIAKNAFEGTHTQSGVWFRHCHFEEVGKDALGTWDQTNVMVQFVYCEQR